MNFSNLALKKPASSADGQPHFFKRDCKGNTFFEFSKIFNQKFGEILMPQTGLKRTLRPPVSERGRKGRYFFGTCKFFCPKN
jgi:hypothetical protein